MTGLRPGAPELLGAIEAVGIVPVLVVDDPDRAAPLAEALCAGGVATLEVTLRGPRALDCIRRMAQVPGVTVGAGTVLTPEQVEQSVEAGACFVISPGFDARVIERSRELGVPVVPGVATASEIQAALALEVTTVKLFPAEQLGGVPLLKALSAPFPEVRFIPTGGISPDSLPAYLSLPAVLAVGGSWLAPAGLVESDDWREVERLTRKSVTVAGQTRAGAGGART